MTTLSTISLHYDLDFKKYKKHLVDVTLTFTAYTDAPILWLPAWIPGSYLIREFARNITAVHYQLDQKEDNKQVDKNSLEADQKNTKAKELTHSSFKHSTLNHRTPNHSTLNRANKISKNEWQLLEVKQGQSVQVTYEVYCYDLSVRTAYVDQTRLYGNFTSLALAVEGQEDKSIQVTLTVPQAFITGLQHSLHHAQKAHTHTVGNSLDDTHIKLVCGLPHTHLQSDGKNNDSTHQYGMRANSYHDLIDYPFELAIQTEFDFIIHDSNKQTLPHHFYISGKHAGNMGRLQTDLTQICQTYLNWLGDAPFGNEQGSNEPSRNESGNGYTFMTYASGNDYGGLEHINSTSLITPRHDLPTANEPDEPSEGYQRFLGLCSHEYFHAWWVKTVRPDVMIDVNLKTEAYTPLLWVFEGFTSYIDDFMLQASGVISKDSYLKLLATQINRYSQTHGRHLQSVAESSFDAWIKLYRSDENTGNAGISYYNKGALVALCLDLLLLDVSAGDYRIFDVVQAFYARAKQNAIDGKPARIGMTTANLREVIATFIDPVVWDDFVERYVNGTEPLPIADLLAAQGVHIQEEKDDNTLAWGISVTENTDGLTVTKVLRNSVASQAGLSAKDVIIAIDGIKATKKQLQRVAEGQLGMVSCHAFRRDELMYFNVPHQTISEMSANPSLDKVVLKLYESGYEDWLAPSFVKE